MQGAMTCVEAVLRVRVFSPCCSRDGCPPRSVPVPGTATWQTSRFRIGQTRSQVEKRHFRKYKALLVDGGGRGYPWHHAGDQCKNESRVGKAPLAPVQEAPAAPPNAFTLFDGLAERFVYYAYFVAFGCERWHIAAMKMTENRFDPSALMARQRLDLDRLNEAVLADERPALVGREGVRLELPEPIFHLLARMVRTLREGKAVALLPESKSMTTQAAAEFLGVSRPFVVALLEKDAIPHHKVGTHRRVYLKDLLDYQRQRDNRRRATLDDLRRQVGAAALSNRKTGGSDER